MNNDNKDKKILFVPKELYSFIESMAKAMGQGSTCEETDAFAVDFMKHSVYGFNQTKDEWLHLPDSREPGRCLFAVPNISVSKDDDEFNVETIDEIKYVDAVNLAMTRKVVCFRWVPYSVVRTAGSASRA